MTGAPKPTSISPCWFDPSAPQETPRFDRDRLATSAKVAGPAIIEDAWSTIVVPPGYAACADTMEHLWINEVAS